MPVDVLVLVVSAAAGMAAQALPRAERARDLLWLAYFWTLIPGLVFVTFLTVSVDRGLLLALAAAIVATWLVAAAGYAYAALATPDREERGVLALAVGFPNTGFVGFPLAQLAFGPPGLALAVVYDRLAWLVPATSVSTAIARSHGRRRVDVPTGRPWLAALANPPLVAMAAALALRATDTAVPGTAAASDVLGAIVGPSGFFLLGLALPLEPPAHGRGELGRAAGALVLRFAGGPAALYATGRALGADVPGAFYLLAAMPSAFHLLVLARVYELRPALMRLLVVGSTVPAVAAVAVGATLWG